MPSNFLLLLPLVGGYLFNQLFYGTKFRAQAQDGYRLVLEAAASGIFFLLIARLFTGVCVLTEWPSWLLDSWARLTHSVPYSGTVCLGALLAPVSAIALNLLAGGLSLLREPRPEEEGEEDSDRPNWLSRCNAASRDYFLDRAIRKSGNAMQKLLHAVAVKGSLEGEDVITIGVTLKSRKVYAGLVTTSPNLSPKDEFVPLLPVMSGYRDADTLEINYVFAYPLDKFQNLRDISEVVVAIPIGEIVSALLLDKEYFNAVLRGLQQPVDETNLPPTVTE